MFCLNCGEAIPDNSKVCPKCGNNLEEGNESTQEAIIYAQAPNEAIVVDNNSPVKKGKLFPKILILVAVVTIVVVLVLAIYLWQITTLKKTIAKEWYALNDSIVKVLEFDDDKVEYRLETGYRWLDTTLFKESYKVNSGTSISIQRFSDKWSTYTVQFNEEKTIMTVTPAITSTDASEQWYDIGD